MQKHACVGLSLVVIALSSASCRSQSCEETDPVTHEVGCDIGNDEADSGFPDAATDGGFGGSCGEPARMALDWDEPSDGFATPAELFGPSAGACHAQLVWDATGLDLQGVEPASGKSDLSVELSIDHDSARLMQPRSGARGPACQAWLEVDAHVTLETADGTFKDAADVTLRYDASNGLSSYGFGRELDEQAGSFSAGSDGGDARLSYEFDGAIASCAGEIQLSFMMAVGEGRGVSVLGPLGAWSKSGCAVGQDPVPPPTAAIEDAFGDATYAGEWDDGLTTELSVQVSVEAETACRDRTPAHETTVPVRVTYGSADDRLGEHASDAVVSVYADDAGKTRGLALSIDETLRCTEARDELPYTLNSCDAIDHVQLQLGINIKGDDVSFRDSGLQVYEYDRDSTAPPGGADRVRVLTLSQ